MNAKGPVFKYGDNPSFILPFPIITQPDIFALIIPQKHKTRQYKSKI